MLTRCPVCKERLLRRRVEMTRKVVGHTFTALLPAQICGKCGESFFESTVVAEFDLRVAEALLQAGETSGAAIRYIRKAAGIAASELAGLLDVRPETVSRWEHDKRPIDRGSYAVLHQLILDQDHHSTATADYLRSLKRPRKLPQRVKLERKAALPARKSA